MATTIKRFLVGRAKRTDQAIHERLTKKTGLAVFASDALSSTAYASEEIMLVLAVAAVYGQTHSFNYVVPITLVIAVVLVTVAISYRQTIHAYPSGGGAYIVAKENLGTYAGLVAAAALLDRIVHAGKIRRCGGGRHREQTGAEDGAGQCGDDDRAHDVTRY